MDRAIRPSAGALLARPASSERSRHPRTQAEIRRRVAIYARQIEEQGHITWLPHRAKEDDE